MILFRRVFKFIIAILALGATPSEAGEFFYNWTNSDQLHNTLAQAKGEVSESFIDYIANQQQKSSADLRAGLGFYVADDYVSSQRFGDRLMIVEALSKDGSPIPYSSGRYEDYTSEHPPIYFFSEWAVIKRGLTEQERRNYKLVIREATAADAESILSDIQEDLNLIESLNDTAKIIEIKKFYSKPANPTQEFFHQLLFVRGFEKLMQIESYPDTAWERPALTQAITLIEDTFAKALPNDLRFSQLKQKISHWLQAPQKSVLSVSRLEMMNQSSSKMSKDERSETWAWASKRLPNAKNDQALIANLNFIEVFATDLTTKQKKALQTEIIEKLDWNNFSFYDPAQLLTQISTLGLNKKIALISKKYFSYLEHNAKDENTFSYRFRTFVANTFPKIRSKVSETEFQNLIQRLENLPISETEFSRSVSPAIAALLISNPDLEKYFKPNTKKTNHRVRQVINFSNAPTRTRPDKNRFKLPHYFLIIKPALPGGPGGKPAGTPARSTTRRSAEGALRV